jgi:hypothetical protein
LVTLVAHDYSNLWRTNLGRLTHATDHPAPGRLPIHRNRYRPTSCAWCTQSHTPNTRSL